MSKDAKAGTIGWQRLQDDALARARVNAAKDARHGNALQEKFEERNRSIAEIAGRRAREMELDAAWKDGAEPGLRAQKEFRENFSDVVSDEKLHGLARAMDVADLVRGNTRPHGARYEGYGNAIRESKDDPHFKEALEYGDPNELAQVMLAAIDTAPVANGEQVASDVIENIRRNRRLGQAARRPITEE